VVSKSDNGWMCIRSLIATMCLLLPTAALAQTSSVPSGPLTLEQTLSVAEANSETVAAAQAGVRRAESELTRARSGRFPQASAVASYDRALASEFSGIFDTTGPAACAPFALNPAAPLDARVSEIERAIDCGAVGSASFGGATCADGGDAQDDLSQLPFGRANTWRFGFSVSQVVYSGGRLGALADIAAAGRESADLNVNATRAQLLFDVTQAYYDAVLSDQLVEIAAATVDQADATLRQVQASFEAGAQPEFELVRARVNRDNQRPALIRQRAAREVAYLRLKQLLELPADYELQLADRLADDTLAPPGPFAETLAKLSAVAQVPERAVARPDLPALTDRNAVREVAAVVRAREASRQAARAERRPSVSATSNFAQITYPSGFAPTGDFRTNWTIGASLQMPILSGGRLGAEERIAQAELDQSRAQLEQVEELAALDTRAAWAELIAAYASWEASSGTIQQAARAYDIANVRFTSGVSTQLELSDARLLLQQSETNRAQAARDLQVARARLALLPNLPLLTSGARTPQPATTTAPIAPQTTPTQLRNAATLLGTAAQTGGRQ
jgi:outer membrane protein TolC